MMLFAGMDNWYVKGGAFMFDKLYVQMVNVYDFYFEQN